MRSEQFSNLILRIGVAFAFLYPPYAALLDPVSWYSYFPHFIRAIPIPEMMLLHGFGIVEVIIALWILSGRRVFIPSVLATLMLLAIVIFNANAFEVVFRDLTIAAMTAALAVGAYRPQTDPLS